MKKTGVKRNQFNNGAAGIHSRRVKTRSERIPTARVSIWSRTRSLMSGVEKAKLQHDSRHSSSIAKFVFSEVKNQPNFGRIWQNSLKNGRTVQLGTGTHFPVFEKQMGYGN